MSPSRVHGTAMVVFAMAALASVWGNTTCWSRLDELSLANNPLAMALLAGAASSVPLLLLAALRLRRSAPSPGRLLRHVLVWAICIWLAYLLATGRYFRGRVGCFAANWAAGVGILLWRSAATPARSRPWSLLAFGICLALVIGELVLRTAANLFPGPLFTRSTSSSAQRLAANAFPPGYLHFGFPTNALGFYDTPFAPPAPGRRPCATVIGDSFSASFVPHAQHYTTVAEGVLADTEVWNVGWPAISPAEYLALLQQQVLPLQPDVVIVSLFLGNDLAETLPWTGLDRALAAWFDRGSVLLLELPRRLLAIAAGVGKTDPARAGGDDLDANPPWLRDPAREPGTFTEAAYLRLETDRARQACDIDPQQWHAFAGQLAALRQAAGARPFGFVLIPDEFMVEDGLWQQVQAEAGTPLDRLALRRRVLEWCSSAGVPCLDLLPALTAVPPLADGDRHLYLRRDTHWNARGNEVAGKALAPFVRQLLRR